MTATTYSDGFYDYTDRTAFASARVVVPLVLGLVPARSAVDVGCGRGGWLAVLGAAGVARLHGIDGPWVDRGRLHIPPDLFTVADVAARVPPVGRFDLALALEVAEHIPEGRAAGFVGDLTGLAPVVLFSAAIPGQGGDGHVNEQWPDYWVSLFAARGYRGFDPLRRRIWSAPEVAWWYRQNLLLFVAEPETELTARLAAEPPILPLVHPELFAARTRKARPGLAARLRRRLGFGGGA